MPISEVFNIDCMEYMRKIPDGFFDLAVVDPPYGDGLGGGQSESLRRNVPGVNRRLADAVGGRRSITCTAANGRTSGQLHRFGQRFDKYKRPASEWPQAMGGALRSIQTAAGRMAASRSPEWGGLGETA